MTRFVEPSGRKEELRARLASAGCRITPQRLAILDALLEPGRHPTADEVHADVLRASPTTSLATVYKTVETLKSLGELRELELGHGRAHYDAADPSDHPHVVCTRCGKVEDVEVAGLDRLLSQAERVSAYVLDTKRLEFFGRCPACRSARPPGSPRSTS